jgi:hypothetical protein
MTATLQRTRSAVSAKQQIVLPAAPPPLVTGAMRGAVMRQGGTANSSLALRPNAAMAAMAAHWKCFVEHIRSLQGCGPSQGRAAPGRESSKSTFVPKALRLNQNERPRRSAA